jgi:hypothetical protein
MQDCRDHPARSKHGKPGDYIDVRQPACVHKQARTADCKIKQQNRCACLEFHCSSFFLMKYARAANERHRCRNGPDASKYHVDKCEWLGGVRFVICGGPHYCRF